VQQRTVRHGVQNLFYDPDNKVYLSAVSLFIFLLTPVTERRFIESALINIYVSQLSFVEVAVFDYRVAADVQTDNRLRVLGITHHESMHYVPQVERIVESDFLKKLNNASKPTILLSAELYKNLYGEDKPIFSQTAFFDFAGDRRNDWSRFFTDCVITV